MNVFWKTLLGGFLCLALMVGARYAKAWFKYGNRGSELTQAEQIRLKNEAIDRQLQRSYAQAPQTTYVAPRPNLPPNHTAPIKPPPFYNPPIKPPNYNTRRN